MTPLGLKQRADHGWIFFATSLAVTVGVGFVAPIASPIVLVVSAALAWISGQKLMVKWLLTAIAGLVTIGIVAGWPITSGGTVQNGGVGGGGMPPTPTRSP